MKINFIKVISTILSPFLLVITFSSCGVWKNFEDWCKTTEDGFEYYYNEYSEDGAYILKVPDVEELTIPEYIDGKKVVELGHRHTGIGVQDDYIIAGNNTKKLTIQHKFTIPNYGSSWKYFVHFPNLTTLIFIDFIYCNLLIEQDEITVPYYIGKKSSNIPNVELRKSEREYSLENFMPKVIIIPEYVRIIEKDVFAGLTGVTIRTSYQTAPEGWQDGWNGNCTVEWGMDCNPTPSKRNGNR